MLQQDNISFWVQSAIDQGHYHEAPVAPALHGQTQLDVAIIGGGFTGLWLAYYLKKAKPQWQVAIFEANQIAYGASGRNGGWLSPHMPGLSHVFQKAGASLDDVRFFQQHIANTIDEVVKVCREEGIDCDLHEGGMLTIATNKAQSHRLQQAYQHDLHLGLDAVQLLSGHEAQQKINVPKVDSGLYCQRGARIQPVKLAFGLKRVLSKLGVHVYENTPVTSFSRRHLSVAGFNIQAQSIVCCTEGYSDSLLRNRKVMPMNSSVIATQVLPESFWQKAHWQHNELFSDASHLFFYAQRTADNRIVIGGRGKPYQYNSVTAGHGQLDEPSVKFLYGKLTSLFPNEPFEVAHAWRGSFGLTRDWCPSVTYNPNTQLGTVYGFGGSGVAGTNLAARTMCERILGEKEGPLARLPWNDFANSQWEPEPVRWLGVYSMYELLKMSDAMEYRKPLPQTAWLARSVYRFCGVSQ